MADHEVLLVRLRPEAAKIDDAMRADLAEVGNDLLAQVLRHGLFNGGKRVRPLLAIFASRLLPVRELGGIDENRLYRLAMVFEYLHAASLLHDDVIDRADQRRGKATVNKVWGGDAAILAGDYLHARAMLIAGSEGGQRALSLISAATSAMVEAEFLQMQNAEVQEFSEEKYFAVLAGKTAALIAAACETGIMVAGGGESEQLAARVYGYNLGLAFQIVDDLLDYLGDPDKTGKAVGNDLVEGKMTLPLIHVLETGGTKERGFLLDLLAADRTVRSANIAAVQAILANANGFGHAPQTAVRLIDTARQALGRFPAGPAAEILHGLGQYVLTRKK